MTSGLEVLGGILNILQTLDGLRICLKAYRSLDKILAESEIKAKKIETSVRTFELLDVLGGEQSRILLDTVHEFENIRDELLNIQEKVTNRMTPRTFVSSPGLIAKLSDSDARLAVKNNVLKIVALLCKVNVEIRSNHEEPKYIFKELRKTSPNFELLESRIAGLTQMKIVDDSIREITVRRKGYRIDQITGYVRLFTGKNLYYCKHGVRDFSAAAQHFHAAANLGWSQAYYYLGMLYMNGWGVERCDVTCKNFFQMGADANYPSAVARLAGCYDEGIGVEKSPIRSVLLAKQAAKGGDPFGMGYYAWTKLFGYNTEVNHSIAFRFAAKAEKRNHALSELARCYEQGIHVDRNPKKAAELYLKAIKYGIGSTARLYLARMYERGDGVDVDLGKAAQVYKDGMKLLPWARPYYQSFYGLCLIRGKGVNQDERNGWKLVQKSIQGHNATGWYVRGECYRNGYGVKQDLVEAVDCYERAMQMENGADGIVFSNYELGKMYERGLGGLRVDLRKAFDHYNYAAKRMHQEAQWKVALFCEKGTGVEKFLDRAAYFFGLAASSGHRGAEVKACEYYMKGKGISRDLHTTIQILQPAADHGDTRAKRLLWRGRIEILFLSRNKQKTQSSPTTFQWHKIFTPDS